MTFTAKSGKFKTCHRKAISLSSSFFTFVVILSYYYFLSCFCCCYCYSCSSCWVFLCHSLYSNSFRCWCCSSCSRSCCCCCYCCSFFPLVVVAVVMGLNLMPREHAEPAAHVHERECHALQVSIKKEKGERTMRQKIRFKPVS